MVGGTVIDLSFSTRLGADAADVWALVSTMDGVNAELRPLLRMTHPPHLRSLTDATWEPGEVIHQSWLLAGGILPIDRHGLALERVLPGEGFDEESSSWLQRRWRHERRVVDDVGTGCTVTDHLIVEPRVALLRPVVARVVQLIFEHRHRRLVARFGAGGEA